MENIIINKAYDICTVKIFYKETEVYIKTKNVGLVVLNINLNSKIEPFTMYNVHFFIIKNSLLNV